MQSPDTFKTFAYSEPECVSYSLIYQLFLRTTNLLLLLSVSSTFYQKYYLLLSYSFFQPLLNIWPEGLLRVKGKVKYLYIRKCNTKTNNSKKQNSGK